MKKVLTKLGVGVGLIALLFSLFAGVGSANNGNGKTVPERELCTTDITGPGGVTAWITSHGVTNGGECFEVGPVSKECGVAHVSLTKQVTPHYPQGPFRLVWNEGDGINFDARKSFPATFDEDYNGGTVTISYYIVGPEKDWLVGSDHPNYWDRTYETLTVDTDCEDVDVVAVLPEVAVVDDCSGVGILTIPETTGVVFDLNTTPVVAGDYYVESGDVVRATALEGFVLTNPDFEYVVEVTVNEDCVTTTTEAPETSSTVVERTLNQRSAVAPAAAPEAVPAADELAFTGSSSTVGTLLGAALLLMGAAALFFGRSKATD